MKKIHGEINKILVPVPLTDEFSVPLKQAMHFNRAYGTEIELLHVVAGPGFPQSVFYRGRIEKNMKDAASRLRSMVLKLFGGEMPDKVRIKIRRGALITAILKEAGDSKMDLIIIKKAEKNRSALAFLKSENADKLISEAVCPVLTITEETDRDTIRDILIPVDIFKKTTNKVAWAISLAKQFKSRLHIVSVLSMDIDPDDSMSVRKNREIEAEIRKEGIEVDTVILNRGSRSIAGTVLDYADKIKPDLLLIMTHQESLLREHYLGSFASEIIHDSKTPVFSVVPSNGTIRDSFFNSFSIRPLKLYIDHK